MVDVTSDGQDRIQSADGKINIPITGNDINMTVPINGEDRFKLTNEEIKLSQVGVDVNGASDQESIINETNNVFKIRTSGSTTISVPAVGGAYATSVTHNLGYVPAILVTVAMPQSATIYYPVNYLLYISSTNYYSMSAWVTPTTIHFQVDLGSAAGLSYLGTYTFKYYLLQETAN